MSCDPGEYEKERFILSTCCLSIDQTRSVFRCRCGADRPVDDRLARTEVKRRLPPNEVRGRFNFLIKRILWLCEEKMIELWKNRKQIMAVLCFFA